MLICTVLTVFVVGAYGTALPKLPRLDGRIVGGESVSITEAPYQVALLLDYWGEGSYAQYCGGAVLSSTVVVTAAHCTDGTSLHDWRIRAGSSIHNSGGQITTVVRITGHPGFVNDYDNDIALMHLKTALKFGPNLAAIPLPAQGQVIPDGADAVITGWGAVYEDGGSPLQLQKVTIPTINQKLCTEAYVDFNNITDNMFCAGLLGVGGKDACGGDSGGPLVIGDTLMGVTSWGRGCADAKYPGVYARVPNYRDWIDSTM